GALLEPVLSEQKHAERVEAGIAQRELVALVVLTEAARATGTRGHVNVALSYLIGADVPRLAAQIVGQVAGGEARRTTLPDVGDLAAGEQIIARRRRQDFGAITEVLHRTLDDAL